jgi:adenosylcobinamide-phosphate synthase
MMVLTAFLLNLVALALALLLDLIFGEPPEKLHPTVWMGHIVTYLEPKFKSKSLLKARIGGVVLWTLCVTLFTVPTIMVTTLVGRYLGATGYVLVSAAILKTTFALKSWYPHIIPVAKALESERIEEARQLTQKTVRRDLSSADEQHIISASVETVAEGIVDGYASPIFYFALFSTPGAIAYRVISTLDSMVGYRDEEHRDLGWFSAKMDTVANCIPARIAAYVMLLASAVVDEDWRRAKKIFVRDRSTLESLNAGWPMSAMAGALGVRLEKAGYYAIGEADEKLTINHIYRAMNVMKATCVIFTVIVAPPFTYGVQLIQRLVVIV